jgi:hypothetical protein
MLVNIHVKNEKYKLKSVFSKVCNLLFDLIYDIQLNHTYAWLTVLYLSSCVLYSVLCSSLTYLRQDTASLGTYFIDHFSYCLVFIFLIYIH